MDARDGRDRRRRGVLVILVLVLLLAGGAVIAWSWWTDRGSGQAGGPGAQPVAPGGTIRDGDTVAGEVSSPGDVDRYEIVVDEVQFSLIDVSANIGVRMISPGEARTVTIPGPYEYAVDEPGRYTLEVTLKDGATGAYRFRVLNRRLRTFDARLGDRIGGRLDLPGRVDVYRVDRTTAARVQVTGAPPCDHVTLGFSYESALDTPDVPTPVQACGGWTSHELAPSDQVAVVVWSDDGRTGDYSLTIEPAG
jgi:hypothetical protein